MRIQQERYSFIDGIRGFAVCNMVIFHFLYDVYMVYGKNPLWYGLPATRLWQQADCWTFIFLSGFVWPWGMKGNLRRGIRLNLYGLLISLVTRLVLPSEAVWFGILNFLGCAILLMFPLQKAAKQISPAWGLGICFLLFLLCKQIQYGFIGMGGLFRIKLPEEIYSLKIFTPFGFPFPGFSSSDYFPILPWIFLYLCGYFFHLIFIKHESWRRIARREVPVLSTIGRKAVWIYLFHQPVCMLVCILFFR